MYFFIYSVLIHISAYYTKHKLVEHSKYSDFYIIFQINRIFKYIDFLAIHFGMLNYELNLCQSHMLDTFVLSNMIVVKYKSFSYHRIIYFYIKQNQLKI